MVVLKIKQILLSVIEKVRFQNHGVLYASVGKDNILPLQRSYRSELSDENVDLAYSPTTKFKIITSTSFRGTTNTLLFGRGGLLKKSNT